MNYLHEEFHWLSNGKELRVTVEMNHDTYHWGSGTTKPRGYEAHYTPCRRGEMFMETGSDDAGSFENVLECDRKSKKRTAEAIKITQDRMRFVMTVFEKKYNPGMITYGELIQTGAVHDASGVDGSEHNFLWAKSSPLGLEVWYPKIQLLGKSKEMVSGEYKLETA